jgi:hypothetical protein
VPEVGQGQRRERLRGDRVAVEFRHVLESGSRGQPGKRMGVWVRQVQ